MVNCIKSNYFVEKGHLFVSVCYASGRWAISPKNIVEVLVEQFRVLDLLDLLIPWYGGHRWRTSQKLLKIGKVLV